jgi:3-oxoacyl-[acyl-carrier-protein] synthase II
MDDGKKRVVVTGIGVAASNGVGKEAFRESCANGKIGIRECGLFPTEKLMTRYFGEICGNLPDSAVPPTDETRIKALMRIAADEVMRDSGLNRSDIKSYGMDAWLCFGTLLATTDGIMEYGAAVKNGVKKKGYLEHVNDYLPWLRDLTGVEGGCWVSSAACAAGTTAAGMAFDFIKNGFCEICFTGGADPLSKVTAAGFHSLKSLSKGICNPFDQNRDGINIGEGAAFFIFETLESAKKRGACIYGEITGYGLANDAYHITSPDPEGTGFIAAMREAARESEAVFSDITHINAHGTGTVINDQTEIEAIERLYADSGVLPSVTSTKALTGHCMGASGAVELAALLLAMENQRYQPLPNLKNPIGNRGGMTGAEGYDCEMTAAISNSMAFAGNIASIVVRRFDDNA